MESFFIIYGKFALCVFAIVYILALIYYIRDFILLLIPAIKCRKVKDCLKDDCPFRDGCRHKKLTDRELTLPWYKDSDTHKKSL